jgi:putative ATPase
MPRETFYEPTTGGYERAITERLRHGAQSRSDRAASDDTTTTGADGDDSTTPGPRKDSLA